MANTITTDEMQNWNPAHWGLNSQLASYALALQLPSSELFTKQSSNGKESGPMAGQSFYQTAVSVALRRIQQQYASVILKTANRDTISTSLAETRRAPTADSRSKKAKSKEAPVAVNKQILPKDLLVHLEKVDRTEEFMSDKYLDAAGALSVDDIRSARDQMIMAFGQISGSTF